MKDIRLIVKKSYSKIAKNNASCCTSDCNCEDSFDILIKEIKESNLGLSCGDPIVFSRIKRGIIVVDLGSGGGRDVFIAAQLVGSSGKVIGIDMTDDMIKLSRKNTKKFKYKTGLNNVDFKKGFIEEIPIKDNFVDLVISNCVINLSPDKGKVFSEVYRILKPGEEMVVSDVVLNKKLPEKIKNNKAFYNASLSGALLKSDYISTIKNAGFKKIKIISSNKYSLSSLCCNIGINKIKAENYASSVTIYAKKEEWL